MFPLSSNTGSSSFKWILKKDGRLGLNYETLQVKNYAFSLVFLSFFLGHEDYDRLRPLFYPQADGGLLPRFISFSFYLAVIIVCSAKSGHGEESIANVSTKWFPEVKHHIPDIPYYLVLNKCDGEHHKEKEIVPENILVNMDGVFRCSALEIETFDVALKKIVNNLALRRTRDWKRKKGALMTRLRAKLSKGGLKFPKFNFGTNTIDLDEIDVGSAETKEIFISTIKVAQKFLAKVTDVRCEEDFSIYYFLE